MPDVCLVIPCYNEARRLPRDAVLAFLGEHAECHVCFVDDGSSDGTAGLLQAIRAQTPERISIVTLRSNGGKAEAVRRGVLAVASSNTFAFIGYWDADLSTPLREVSGLVDELNRDERRVLALGSRWLRLGSRIERSAVRHLLGRLFASAASSLLNLPVYDSQCGAKIFRASAAQLLFEEPFTTRWLFDVEILARMRNQLGRAAVLECAVEVPLGQWRDVSGSKLSLVQMAGVPLDLLRIRRRYGHAR